VKPFNPSDLAAAFGGVLAAITLAHVNALLTTLSLVSGLVYLAWKWRREAKGPPGK